MEPFLSIITATHNIVEKKQVEEFDLQVQLLKLQTYKNFEHIVIDNASNDGTVELLKKYQEQGLLTYYSQTDINKYDAYNKGIQQAKGKHVSFLSCDDFYHDITSLFDLVKLLETEKPDICVSPSYCRHPQDFVFLYIPSVLNAFQVMPCPRQSMFFKKDVLLKEKMFDTQYNYLSEFDLIVRLMMKRCKIAFFNRCYTTYKLGQKIYENEMLANADVMNIFYKNYNSLYKLDETLIGKMVKFSEFPKGLLDKLAEFIPIQDRQEFYAKCDQMHNMRVLAQKQLEKQ